MISVIMPFWNRASVLRLNLARYFALYLTADLEIVIISDGSPEPPVIDCEFPWTVRIVWMPPKESALNPCAAINAGVKASKGDLVLLTSPEIWHRAPILEEMAKRLVAMGPRSYLAAACWHPKQKRWLCHSLHRTKGPQRAGLHFCSIMRRDIFEEIGGFDEAYRDGQAVEDVDFLYKLHAAEVRCAIADDLVVEHLKTARSQWPIGGLDRNLRIFERKWGEKLI